MGGYNFGLFRATNAHAVVFESYDGNRSAIRQCETAEAAASMANNLNHGIEHPMSLQQFMGQPVQREFVTSGIAHTLEQIKGLTFPVTLAECLEAEWGVTTCPECGRLMDSREPTAEEPECGDCWKAKLEARATA